MNEAAAKRTILDRLAAISDGAILRTAFYALLAGTLTVLYIDYNELKDADVSGIATPFTPVPVADAKSVHQRPGIGGPPGSVNAGGGSTGLQPSASRS